MAMTLMIAMVVTMIFMIEIKVTMTLMIGMMVAMTSVPLVPMIVTKGAGTRGYNYCVELH